jgi:hypothetical protein
MNPKLLLKIVSVVLLLGVVPVVGKIGADSWRIKNSIESLKHSDWQVRSSAAKTLIDMHRSGEVVIPNLLPLLKDERAEVRSDGVQSGKDGHSKCGLRMLY